MHCRLPGSPLVRISLVLVRFWFYTFVRACLWFALPHTRCLILYTLVRCCLVITRRHTALQFGLHPTCSFTHLAPLGLGLDTPLDYVAFVTDLVLWFLWLLRARLRAFPVHYPYLYSPSRRVHLVLWFHAVLGLTCLPRTLLVITPRPHCWLLPRLPRGLLVLRIPWFAAARARLPQHALPAHARCRFTRLRWLV